MAKGGLTEFEETFVLGSTVVLRMNISAEFPALRQAANRYQQRGTRSHRNQADDIFSWTRRKTSENNSPPNFSVDAFSRLTFIFAVDTLSLTDLLSRLTLFYRHLPATLFIS